MFVVLCVASSSQRCYHYNRLTSHDFIYWCAKLLTLVSKTREIFATQLESLLPEEMYLLGFFLNIEMKRLVFQ